jgi:hypothetical protein
MNARTAPSGATLAGPGVARGADVRFYDSVHEIDPSLWDSMVSPDELQSSHAFVRACEDARVEDARYRHLVIRHRGEPIGVASLSLMPVRLDLLSTGLVRSAMEAARRLRPSMLQPKVLFCGLPVSAGRPCLGIRRPADAPRVLAGVSAAMEEVGGEWGAQLHCVKEFSAAEARVMDGLVADHGFFRAWSLPSFRMAVPWRSFSAYIGGMRAGYRRQVRTSLEVARRERISVRRVVDWSGECEVIHALYEQVLDRAEFRLERLNLAFFRNLNTYLGARAPALLIERDGRLLAAALLLRSPGLLTFFMAGIDYELNRRCAAYLNLTNQVVAEAIRSRAPSLELGQTSAALKTRMGASATDRFIYFRCPARLANAAFRVAAPTLFPATGSPRRRVFRDTVGAATDPGGGAADVA